MTEINRLRSISGKLLYLEYIEVVHQVNQAFYFIPTKNLNVLKKIRNKNGKSFSRCGCVKSDTDLDHYNNSSQRKF